MYLSKAQILTIYNASIEAQEKMREVDELLTHNKEFSSIPDPIKVLIKENIKEISERLKQQQMQLGQSLNGNTNARKSVGSYLVDNLGLSDRQLHLLKRNNIFSIDDLINFLKEHSLTECRGCGCVTAEKIEEALERYLKKEQKI